jgi:hypothetical protein
MAEEDRKDKVYIRIDDEEEIQTLENGSIIHTTNKPFSIAGNVIFAKLNEEISTKTGKKFEKSTLYIDEHDWEIYADKVIVLSFSYTLFRQLLDKVEVEAGDKIEISYIGKYKKAKEVYPELEAIFRTANGNMKIFDIYKE